MPALALTPTLPSDMSRSLGSLPRAQRGKNGLLAAVS